MFPPGSRIDPDRPPPVTTPIHYPEWGAGMYTAAPIGQTVRVLDLDTGRDLWTSPLLTGVATVPATAGRPAALLTGHPDGRLELRDPRSGVLRQPLDPVGGPPLYAERAGDSVLVRSESHLALYSADRWQRRWIRALSTDGPNVGACGSMLCLEGRTGIEVLDPVTGGTAWRSAGRVSLRGHGVHLVEVGENAALGRAVDPRSGRTVVDLAGWTEVPTPTESAPMLLLRHAGSGGRTWVGLLDPEGTAVRPLGPLPYALSSCRWTARLLACRTGDGVIRVWRYAPGSTPPG
ncbi:PQQ-binding-like beta-propeller repeat protein [Plantactinospora veratri]